MTPYFTIFIGVWIYLRHYINLHILWATLTEFHTVGPYELNWETQQYKCLLSQVITFTLLASLQAVNLFWLFLILRVAKRTVFNNVLADERSDVEDNDEDGHNEPKTPVLPSVQNMSATSTALPNGRLDPSAAKDRLDSPHASSMSGNAGHHSPATNTRSRNEDPLRQLRPR